MVGSTQDVISFAQRLVVEKSWVTPQLAGAAPQSLALTVQDKSQGLSGSR